MTGPHLHRLPTDHRFDIHLDAVTPVRRGSDGYIGPGRLRAFADIRLDPIPRPLCHKAAGMRGEIGERSCGCWVLDRLVCGECGRVWRARQLGLCHAVRASFGDLVRENLR